MNCFTWNVLFLCIASLLIPAISPAATVTVTSTGEYIMGDNDTFTEGKKLALQDAKRLVLEKVGTYIESTTEVKNGSVSNDEIKQYTAGIIKVEVLDEQRHIIENKASVVKVTARAIVDPDEVVRQLLALQNRKEVEAKAKKLSSENENLRNEIALLNQQLRSITDGKKNRELRDQRDAALQKILDNEKGLTMLVSGESLVKASLYDQQKKHDERLLVKKFLHEVAGAYQIISDEPEVEDNGDGTSNVTIRYSIQLPGRFDLRQSSIDVPSIDEFLTKGFVIKAFSNGGLIVRCADYRNSKCNKTLSPYFDKEALKMRISVKLGENIQTEALGITESAISSKQKYVQAPAPRIREAPTPPPPRVPPGSKISSSSSQAGRWPAEERSTMFQKSEPGGIYYPLVNSGSYACVFKRIHHTDLQKVSRIEIKVLYE